MAIKKNPDWHVWLGDVAHWATKPPQLFILIIVAIAGVVFAMAKQTSPSINYQAARPAPPPVVVYTNTRAPQIPQVHPDLQQPSLTPAETALQQQMRAAHIEGINPYARGIEFKNKCPVDYIFFDSLNACTAVLPLDRIRMDPGNTFQLSRIVEIQIASGSLHLRNAIHPVGDTFSAPARIRIIGGRITSLTPVRIQIRDTN